MNQLDLGFQVMGYGLVGVFTVLILFFFMIKGLLKLFPYKAEEDND